MKNYNLNENHHHFGKVIAMGIREGEPYRFFKDRYGTISLIPLCCLSEESE